MKRALAGIGIVVGALALMAGAFVAYIAVTGIPRYTPRAVELHVEATAARVDRGKKLALLLCADCHESPVTRAFTGKVMADSPPAFGRICSKNITRHPQKGIGSRSDGELAYLLRTGVRWDGQYIPPYMVRLPHMADEDIASILAFLRSDDDLVRASDVDSEPVQPSFLVKFLSHVAWKPTRYPDAPIALPPRTDAVAYGRYMVDALSCFACHSKDFKTLDENDPPKSEGYMGGGNMLLQMSGTPIYASNLTPDDETGIGRWSADDFRHALRDGFRKDGSLVRYPMNRMPQLAPDEADAIFAYLRTVPKLRSPKIATPPDPAPLDDSPGSRVYHRYACQTCHGESGIAFGDLRGAKVKYPTDAALVAFLKAPASVLPDTKMPAWDGVIKEEEYGPLCEYVRKLGVP
jgi:mono/diheme cytochrome c family protein